MVVQQGGDEVTGVRSQKIAIQCSTDTFVTTRLTSCMGCCLVVLRCL